MPLSKNTVDFELNNGSTSKGVLLQHMKTVAFAALIEPHDPKGTKASPVTGMESYMRRGKRKKLNPNTEIGQLLEAAEQAISMVCAVVAPPFRVIKHQFGYVKVR